MKVIDEWESLQRRMSEGIQSEDEPWLFAEEEKHVMGGAFDGSEEDIVETKEEGFHVSV
jgi:hypothetical protein